MSTNIGRDKTDASYRYKMPVLMTKIEGRGNGIKTVITNIKDIAQALHIHPAYPTKYFGIELGAQSKYIAKDERAVINGSFLTTDLAKMLEKFIEAFILCPNCGLPELKMVVKSSIKIDCAACGYNGEIKTNHKLASYIIKNPPSTLKEGRDHTKDKERKKAILDAAVAEEVGLDKEEREKKQRKVHKRDQKRAAREASSPQETNGEDKSPAEDASDDLDDENREEEKGKKNKEKKEKKEKKSKKEKDEDVWHTDTSKEAVKARQEAEFKERIAKVHAAKEVDLVSLSIGDDSNSAVNVLRLFIHSRSRTSDAILAELQRIAISRELDERNKIRVLLEAYLLLPNEVAKTVATTKLEQCLPVLKEYSKDKQNQILLLNGIEELVGSTDKRLLPLTGHFLKTLYEGDVCEEEIIVEWYNAPVEASMNPDKEAVSKVKAKARVIVEWLLEAEEESSEED